MAAETSVLKRRVRRAGDTGQCAAAERESEWERAGEDNERHGGADERVKVQAVMAALRCRTSNDKRAAGMADTLR